MVITDLAALTDRGHSHMGNEHDVTTHFTKSNDDDITHNKKLPPRPVEINVDGMIIGNRARMCPTILP